METNWRVVAGMGGALYQGLDYASLIPVIELRFAKRKQQKEIFESVRLIELGALERLNSGNEESSNYASNSG